MIETKENYKELGFHLISMIREKCKERQLSKSEARCEVIREIRKCLATKSKYFSYLSGLTVKELRDIARESGLYGYTAFRKASLIKFLDKRRQLIKKRVEERMFLAAMKAWVELFADGNFSEHYTKVILNTLPVVSETRCDCRKCVRWQRNEIFTEGESDEDIGDNWRRL